MHAYKKTRVTNIVEIDLRRDPHSITIIRDGTDTGGNNEAKCLPVFMLIIICIFCYCPRSWAVTLAALLDHLVGAAAYCDGEGDAERLCGLHVNPQLDFRYTLHREIAGLLALQDAAAVNADLAHSV